MGTFCRSAIVVVAFIVADVYGSSKLALLNLPNNVQLTHSGNQLFAAEFPILLGNFMGLTADKPTGWDITSDLFRRPKASVVIAVRTKEPLENLADNAPSFSLVQGPVDVDSALSVAEKGKTAKSLMATLQDGKLVANFEIPTLLDEGVKTKTEPLRRELLSLKSVIASLAAVGDKLNDGEPDFYHFEIDGLQTAVGDIKELSKTLQKLVIAFKNAYDTNVLIQLITVDGAKSRPKRQAPTPKPEYKEDRFASSDRSAAFAIILGVVILMGVTVLFVSYGMLSMDPGKDSILHRMTTTRIKRE